MVQQINSVELNEAILDDTEQTCTGIMVVWYGIIWYGMVWYGINNLPSRLALLWCGCAHGSNNLGMVWHGMWYGMVYNATLYYFLAIQSIGVVM